MKDISIAVVLIVIALAGTISEAGVPARVKREDDNSNSAESSEEQQPTEQQRHVRSNSLNGTSPFVIGGRDARITDWPWFAWLEGCGASLINNKWLITAAHCLFTQNGQQRKIERAILGADNRANTRNAVIVLVSRQIPHPNYDPRTISNDVALLELAQEVQFTQRVRPIAINSDRSLRQTANIDVKVVGFGRYDDSCQTCTLERLQEAELSTVAADRCSQLASAAGGALHSSDICAFSRTSTSCHGDSGGPMVRIAGGRTTLVGTVSRGFSGRCSSGNPTVYHDVSTSLDWVRRIAGSTIGADNSPSVTRPPQPAPPAQPPRPQPPRPQPMPPSRPGGNPPGGRCFRWKCINNKCYTTTDCGPNPRWQPTTRTRFDGFSR